jgi:hypothetical protein
MLRIRKVTGFQDIWEPGLAAQHAGPTDHPSWPIATALRAVLEGLFGAVRAHRQYENLRSRGTPHDRALRQALGISHPTSELPTSRSTEAGRSPG